MIRLGLRADDECPGIASCSDRRPVVCRECSSEYGSVGGVAPPGKCPECGSGSYKRQPCDGCPTARFARYLTETIGGDLLRACMDIDQSIQIGLSVNDEEINEVQRRVLGILFSERNKYTEEKRKSEERRAELTRRRS